MFTSKSHLSKTAFILRTNKLNAKDYVRGSCKISENKDIHIKALISEKNREKRLLAEVDKLRKRFPDKNNLPPLYGVLVGIKDIVNAEGFKTKGGSKLPAKLFKGKEASLVTKLKDVGAIVMGKTVTTEFAYFEPGETRNPHNIEHTPGGSSSGSAAAVASGIVPLAIGTQTIGSIIRPAAYCGIVGFKPSFDRIEKDGVIPFSVSADHIGIFTQDIEGIDLAASVLCDDWEKEVKKETKPIIGAVDGKYLQQAEPEIIEFFEEKILQLLKSGYIIKRINPFEDIDDINFKHQNMNAREFYEVHKKWFKKHEQKYREGTKELILKGKKVSDKDYIQAIEYQKVLRIKIEKMKKVSGIDIWLSPATTSPAPKGMQTGSPLMNLPWTYAGLPAITIPAGKAKNSLPIGLQLTGSFYKDEELIAFAKIVENSF
ncbi:MAG: amidase [Bacteroidales bacterium]|nr:amidase [Bacteroidales bacterium]